MGKSFLIFNLLLGCLGLMGLGNTFYQEEGGREREEKG